jgi:hypothetical protein
MYLRHPWCAPPLAQTFPQLAQHVVERGALTHSHDSERSSLCSQRGSLSALLASLCSLPRFRSPRFTNSGTAHGRSASSKKGSSAAATVWTRSASTSEPVREAACRGIAKRRVRGDKRCKKHKETRTPPPPSPLPAYAKNFDCKAGPQPSPPGPIFFPSTSSPPSRRFCRPDAGPGPKTRNYATAARPTYAPSPS